MKLSEAARIMYELQEYCKKNWLLCLRKKKILCVAK